MVILAVFFATLIGAITLVSGLTDLRNTIGCLQVVWIGASMVVNPYLRKSIPELAVELRERKQSEKGAARILFVGAAALSIVYWMVP